MLRRSTVVRGEPLLSYLIATLGLNRRTSKNLLKFDAVKVNGLAVRQFDHPLAAGDQIVIDDVQTAVAAGRLKVARIQVVHEDDAFIVVDKPAGLLTVATDHDKTDTLFVRLNEYLQATRATQLTRALVVHRLDRETSGLVLFAKTADVQAILQAAWRSVEKHYWAIVVGSPEPPQGTITSYLTESASLKVFSNTDPTPDGRLAVTHYRVLQTRGDFSLLEVRLETGRKHQIRVHLAGKGCPVAGDRRYGETLNPCRRLALHASSLAFDHPLTGERLHFESPLPAAFRRMFPTWTAIDASENI